MSDAEREALSGITGSSHLSSSKKGERRRWKGQTGISPDFASCKFPALEGAAP
jgi:hypothetical protein